MKPPVRTVYRLLLLWLAVRALNLFVLYVAEHSALHTEARLLVQHLCDTTHNRKISGALIDCNTARSLINAKGFAVTYAIEKTLRTIVLDCWFNASQGLASLVQLLGLITTLMFTSALCLQHMVLGAQRIRYARSAYGESYLETLGTRRLPARRLEARSAAEPRFDDDFDEGGGGGGAMEEVSSQARPKFD
jgi:hypothetical protein